MNRVLLPAALLAAIVLTLTACGGDDDTSGTPAPSPGATATSTPAPSPTPAAEVQLVSYVDADGDIWVASPDGGEPTLFVDTGPECPNPTELIWSPDGEHVACFGFDGPASTTTLAVYGPDSQVIYSEASSLNSFVWNPDGDSFAYTVIVSGRSDLTVRNVANGDVGVSVANAESPAWSPDGRLAANRPGDDSAFLDIYEGTEATSIPGDYRPLAWVLGGDQILVGANYAGAPEFGLTFEAFLLDPASEAATRVPELDSRLGLFWVSPDGASAVFVQPQPGPPELAVIDFATLAVTPIQDSQVGYPSEFIPSDHVAFAPGGGTVFWADVAAVTDGIQAVLYEASLAGPVASPLATLPGAVSLKFSPDRSRVAYTQAGASPSLWVAGVDGSSPLEITPAFAAFSWRPLLSAD